MESVVFTEYCIIVAISKLKSNLSSVPDCLPPFLFKKLKYCLAQPLASVYTQMFSVSFVPNDWSKAIIIPVYKNGVSGDFANYRPISLTCVGSKIMERITVKQIYKYLLRHNLISHCQHGFIRGPIYLHKSVRSL